MLSARDIAKMIDHSLLRPEMTTEDVINGCSIAKRHGVASVCVKPCDVSLAKKELEGSGVLVTTVIGFPHGANCTATKVFETKQAIDDGAEEIDMVLNIGKLRSRKFYYVAKDIKAVVDLAHEYNVIAKVILENCYLSNDLKEIACIICEKIGVDFVKTSTGYGPWGASIEDVRLMRRATGDKVKIKAAGGVRTLSKALEFRQAGVQRFGTTKTESIMEEALLREAEGRLEETFLNNL